jgi:hypothetical protein
MDVVTIKSVLFNCQGLCIYVSPKAVAYRVTVTELRTSRCIKLL